MGTWRISVRNPAGQRVGVVDIYDKLTYVDRDLGLGTWVLELPLDLDIVPDLVAPGAGIIVELDDVVQFSGPRRQRGVVIDDTNRSLTVAGYNDLAVLAYRRVHPQPGTASPPYGSSAYDVRSGPAETVVKQYVDVNAGPSALSFRRKTGLTIVASTGAGATVTGRGRWNELLAFVTELCVVGGIGIRCRDLVFDTYARVDRSSTVEFSDDRGSVGAQSFADDAPAATFAYIGGGGEGASRTIVEAQNAAAVAEGWDRIETFGDRRDTTDPTELAQAAALALIGDGSTATERVGVTFTPLDVEGCAYGVDYFLGDTVAYVSPFGQKSTKTVQGVKVEITPSLVSIVPTLGTIDPDISAQFARLQALARRTARLEVR